MPTITETVRTALEQCGQTQADVCRATGIDKAVLSRFAAGGSLLGGNLDKLVAYLGLELRPVKPAKKRAAKAKPRGKLKA